MEKESLARECGVAVRSIEYWFWARNKKLRADPDAFSPGGTRYTKIISPVNPEKHWSSWDPNRPLEEKEDSAKKLAKTNSDTLDDDWMSESAATPRAAAPVEAGADSLLSSGAAPQQLQDLLGGGASRFPNVEIPADEEGAAHGESPVESPLEINSGGSGAGGGASWTDGAEDGMGQGCWGWNEEHGNENNPDGACRHIAPHNPKRAAREFLLRPVVLPLQCRHLTHISARVALLRACHMHAILDFAAVAFR